MGKQVITFSIDPEQDRDLVRWLAGLPKRQKSTAIREVLRAGLAQGGLTLGDVYQAIKDLDRRLAQGMVSIDRGATLGEANDWAAEDPDAAAALDALVHL